MIGDDQDILARTCWAEARGDDIASTPEHDGMEAVAAVIMTRASKAARYKKKWGNAHPIYGDGTVKSACLRPKQFSCWNIGDPNLAKINALTEEDEAFRTAKAIARRAIAGELVDPTGGATHYVTRAFYDKAPAGHWCKQTRIIATIVNHVFFKEP